MWPFHVENPVYRLAYRLVYRLVYVCEVKSNLKTRTPTFKLRHTLRKTFVAFSGLDYFHYVCPSTVCVCACACELLVLARRGRRSKKMRRSK